MCVQCQSVCGVDNLRARSKKIPVNQAMAFDAIHAARHSPRFLLNPLFFQLVYLIP